MQIDGDVEAPAPQPPRERDVVEQTPQRPGVWAPRSVVEMRVAVKNRSGRGLDDIGEMGVGIAAPKRPDERRGEDDVADQAQADEEDPQWQVVTGPLYGSIVASSMSITGMSSLIG